MSRFLRSRWFWALVIALDAWMLMRLGPSFFAQALYMLSHVLHIHL